MSWFVWTAQKCAGPRTWTGFLLSSLKKGCGNQILNSPMWIYRIHPPKVQCKYDQSKLKYFQYLPFNIEMLVSTQTRRNSHLNSNFHNHNYSSKLLKIKKNKNKNKALAFEMDADLYAQSAQTTKKTLKKSNMQSRTPETCTNVQLASEMHTDPWG